MWRNFARKTEAGWLAVVRRAERFELVHAVCEGAGRPVLRYCEALAAGDEPALARLVKARGLKRYRCATLLGDGQYRFLQVAAPAVPVEERLQALRWHLKDLLDFPVDGAALDCAEIPVEGGRGANVFALAAPAPVIGECMSRYAAAGLQLAAIDVPEMAQRNVAVLFEEENRGLAFLSLGEGGGLLTITFRGELYLARALEFSVPALAAAENERRGQMLERLVLDLQRTLDNFDRQYSFIPVARLLLAVAEERESLLAALRENLYVPVDFADLTVAVDCSAVPEMQAPARQVASLFALGAALRAAA